MSAPGPVSSPVDASAPSKGSVAHTAQKITRLVEELVSKIQKQNEIIAGLKEKASQKRTEQTRLRRIPKE